MSSRATPTAAPTATPTAPAASSALLPPGPLLLDVEGMKCGGCVRAVEQRLQQQPGVRQVSVNLLTRTAWVELDPKLADVAPEQRSRPLEQALAAMGYSARPRSSE
ncbi:MAG: heavy-metal-associated domain-containing protein, partial [Cyanobacteriota bacterium]